MENTSDAAIKERDGNRCARCGAVNDLHVHHRQLRSAGADERACNRVTLCAVCHHWVHYHPGMATEAGWLVSRYDDPGQVPVRHVLWPGVQVLLTDENAGVKIWLE